MAEAAAQALADVLGDKVSFPGSEGYSASNKSYFSQQNLEIEPVCIVTPTSTADVAAAIRVLTSADSGAGCKFAIRSGGFMAKSGANNAAGGITIDLRRLDAVEVSADKKTVSVGPGANWGAVYGKLDPLGLSVTGGRVSQVGVAGLTIGGGLAYTSPRFGWACDSVTAFEVVLADGSVVTASDAENADLLVALRGGSNNFGVVTRIDFAAFEQGPAWGGITYHGADTLEDQIKAFVDFNSADAYDEYAALMMSFGFAPAYGPPGIVNSIKYTKAEERPATFEPFLKIPAARSTIRTAGLADFATEQGAFVANGARASSSSIAHASTAAMLKSDWENWHAHLDSVKDIPGIVFSLSLQPLPPAIYKRAPEGNSMGLGDRTGSLVLVNLSVSWLNADDDSKVESAMRGVLAGIERDARARGEYDPFVWLNNAAPWQDPIASYGAERVKMLRRVRDRVDPKGVFTHLVPGGFKIPSKA